MTIGITGLRNHDCLESDIFPVTKMFITFNNINIYCLESDKMVIFTEELFQEIVDYYVNKHMTCSDISDLVGINKGTIWYWLKKNDIPRRDKNTQRKGKKRKPFTKEHCENISKSKIRTYSEAQRQSTANRRNLSENFGIYIAHGKRPWVKIDNSGENNPNWKGGISRSRSVIYDDISYTDWRMAIFKRDNYTCKICGDNTGHNLEAHHIVPFAFCIRYNIALLYKVGNGITFCKECHQDVHILIREKHPLFIRNFQKTIEY